MTFEELEKAGEAGRQEILAERGGCMSIGEVATLLGVDGASVARQAANLQLVAAKGDDGSLLFPRWQFSGNAVVRNLPEVLAILRGCPYYGDMTAFAFFLGPHPLTGGETPIDALAAGNFAAVEKAARSTH